jgi:hypothetical protein
MDQVDHFHNDTRYAPHSNDTFRLRYFLDDTYYEPGGPVIILAGGETSGEDRLRALMSRPVGPLNIIPAFLETGIVNILARATSGIGIMCVVRWLSIHDL